MRLFPARRAAAPAEGQPVLTKADVDEAYARGRKDERTRRRTHPLITALVAIIALIGVGTIYLAAREGSFARGGEVVDHKLQGATAPAQAVTREASLAMNNAGQKLQDAGTELRQNSSGSNGSSGSNP
jgi:hypothetical protein